MLICMGAPRGAIAIVICIVVGMSGLSPPGAVASPEPLSTPRVMPFDLPSTGTMTVQPGGTGAVNSPSLPSTARSISVNVRHNFATGSLEDDFTTMLSGESKKDQRLTCVYFGAGGLHAAQAGNVAYAQQFFAMAAACFRAISQLAAPRTTRTDGCGAQVTAAVPMAVTHTSAGYTVAFTGPVRTVRPKFTARCTVKGGNLTLRIKAKKGKTLARVIGPTVNIGVASAPTNTAPAQIAVTFNKPR